jgi:hypothetical protein
MPFEQTPMTQEQHEKQADGFSSAHGCGCFAIEELK